MPKLYIALLILFCLCQRSLGAERVVMKVILNQEDKGDFILIIGDDGRVLLSPSDILDIGFNEAPSGAETGEKGFVALDAISGRLKYELDRDEGVVHITAEPGLLRKNILDLSGRRGISRFYEDDKSAFLNYGISYEIADDINGRAAYLSAPLEIGARVGGWTGLSNFSYFRSDTDERFVRLMTNITRDDRFGPARLVLGDVQAYSGLLGSKAILGGVSISTDFQMQPYLIRYPGMDLSGMVYIPSDVEVYANNMLIRRDHFSAGEFEYQNIPNIHGAGEVSVVVRDAFGREERVEFPYYISTMLLKPGLQEYSYSLGFNREEFGFESFQYGDLAFLGFHRKAFSGSFTGGFRAEADKDVLNAGPTATFLLGDMGELDSSIAFSHSGGRSGYGLHASYSYVGRKFNVGFSGTNLSRDYANLVLAPSDDKPCFEGTASAGFRQDMLGSFSVAYSVSDWYEGVDSKELSIYYSRRILDNISFNLSASRIDSNGQTYEVFAGLTFVLGGDVSGSLNHYMNDDEAITTATIQKNTPSGRGLGYRVTASRLDSPTYQDTGLQGFMQYNGAFGKYSAEIGRLNGLNRYTASAAGGVAFINNSFYLSRPIYDGFAVVKVGDLENVRVLLNNNDEGRTGANGDIMIPGLRSYEDNRISINDSDVPVNYAIPAVEKLAAIPFRSGALINFDILKLQAFTGRVYIAEKGGKTEAEYWGFELQAGESATETVAGKKGVFYMENIPAGRYPARLFKEDKVCTFYMVIPQSDDIQVEMGEIICEMD